MFKKYAGCNLHSSKKIARCRQVFIVSDLYDSIVSNVTAKKKFLAMQVGPSAIKAD